jgi:hypothetical protein
VDTLFTGEYSNWILHIHPCVEEMKCLGPWKNNSYIISMYYILFDGDGISNAVGFRAKPKKGEGK